MFVHYQKNKCLYLFLLFVWSPIYCFISYASEQPVMVLENSDPVTAIAFSPDGSKLVTGWGKCFIWDMNSGQKILTINSSGASCAAFSPNGKMVATGTDPILSAIWNAEMGEKIQAFNYKYNFGTGPIVLSAIVFHPHESYVITSTSDGYLSKWNINTGNEISLINLGSLIDRIQVFSDGDRIATYMDIISMKSKGILHEFESRISITSNEKYVYRNSSVNGEYYKRQIKVYDATNFSLIK